MQSSDECWGKYMSVSERWLLLDYQDDLLERLYREGDHPDPQGLFTDTELEPYADHSPRLINAAENPAIATAFLSNPSAWGGLQIDSQHPVQVVLQHLRHILFIGFGGGRRGVLRYFSPRTASYFFTALEASEWPIWLGPIGKLSWYGATWGESAERQAHWYRLENVHAEQWQSDLQIKPLTLGANQAQALQRQQMEKFLFLWWQQQTQVSFDQAFSYLQDGMQSGFVSAQSLSRYLNIRSANSAAIPPRMLPDGNDDERLGSLQVALQGSSTYKEGLA